MPLADRNQRRVPSRVGFALLAFVCCLTTPPLSSQEDALESFGETLDVVVVEVEAVVTDSRGRRVSGLSREDLRLLVDGREVPIEYFAEVRDGHRVEGPDTEGRPPLGRLAGEGVESGDPVSTNYLVFVDDYFSIGDRRDYVLERVAVRARELPSRDRMAVVAFDGERIELLAGWDSSRPELIASVEAAVDRPAHGLKRASEWVRRGHAGPWHDAVAQDEELERVVTAVRSTLRTLRRPEGRKVLLLLGGAWPVRDSALQWPEDDRTFPGLPTAYGPRARLDDLARIRQLADSANFLGYTVYPVDVNGLRAPGGLRRDGDTPFTRELFRHGTLRALGGETGGKALLFADRDRALDAAVEDTRSYYSLGFTPDLERNDLRHDIRLEIRRPGLEVRARTGYLDLSRRAELDLLAESALRFDVSGDDAAEDALTVELGDPRERRRRTMVVPLRLDLPWRAVTLLPSDGGLVSRFEIRLAVRDREGSVSEVATVPVEKARTERPDAPSLLRWETDLTLRRERHDLVVSVYDAHSGRILTRRVSVEP